MRIKTLREKNNKLTGDNIKRYSNNIPNISNMQILPQIIMGFVTFAHLFYVTFYYYRSTWWFTKNAYFNVNNVYNELIQIVIFEISNSWYILCY